MKKRLGTITLILALVLAALPASHAAPAAPQYTVTNTNDSGANSLRWAINQANADGAKSFITFSIPGTGVHTIQPLTPLPALVEDGTTINGYSQPGADEATDEAPATLVIEIDGTNMTSDNNGLNIWSAENTIKGLAINRFDWSGIAIYSFGGTEAMSNTITGNFIGTDPSGATGLGNTLDGVSILLGAHDNTIGGDSAADRNVIGGNGGDGVGIYGDNTTGNVVLRNAIGIFYPWADLGNASYGINIYGGAYGNTIGSDGTARENRIYANNLGGIRIAGANTRDNVVVHNYIGVYALGNDGDGVILTDGTHDNIIGPRNSILNSGESGVLISGTDTVSNTVSGNLIFDNTQSGIYIASAQNNIVGGDTESERNVIVGNSEGIYIGHSAQNNTVSGNYIGVDSNGTVWANGCMGVEIDLAQNNTVGPNNVISGNGCIGIYVYDAQDNTIFGNYIGTDVHGMASAGFGNVESGIKLSGSSTDNIIGGATTAEGNLIYSNGIHGVHVAAAGSTGNTISHNSIEYNGGEGIKVPGGWTPSAPIIAATALGSVHITGTACVGCTVEVFQSHLDSGEGLTFVGETTADSSGAFTVTVDSLSSSAPYLTATATDAANNTSEFSAVFESTIKQVYLPLVLRGD
jgi:parallel beta-helix repeat protein